MYDIKRQNRTVCDDGTLIWNSGPTVNLDPIHPLLIRDRCGCKVEYKGQSHDCQHNTQYGE